MRILSILSLSLTSCCQKPPAVPTFGVEIAGEAQLPIHASQIDRLIQNAESCCRDQTVAELTGLGTLLLLSFSQAEVARKSFRLCPQIAAESREAVRLWGEPFDELLLKRSAAESDGA